MVSERIAILLIGGSGTRFGGKTPKQLFPILGKPLFCYALETLNRSSSVDAIYLVVKEGTLSDVKESAQAYEKIQGYILGGGSREDSVDNAISFLEKEGASGNALVLIQDGDRPNLTERMIEENFQKASVCGAAVTAMPCSDSVFCSEDGETVSRYLNRNEIYQAQTPQTFRFSLLKKALRSATGATDDASRALLFGAKPAIVRGESQNYKINTEEDMERFRKEVSS